MPLSLRLAALVAAGSAGGLQLPQASWRLLACLVAGAGGFAWVAHVCRVRGATRILIAVAVVGTAALRAVAVAEDAARPPLVRWFDRQTEGTLAGEARLRETAVKVRGRLVRDASATEYGAQIQLAVSDIEIDGAWQAGRGGIGVSIAGVQTARLQDWRAGRTIVVPVDIRRPTQYRNRGLPDQARALAWRGTPLVASAKSGLLVESEGPGAWWDEGAATMRAQVRAAMQRRVAPLDPMSAAIGTAILIGDRAELSPEVEQRLQEAGTYHVVAISGGNIALLAGAVLALLWIAGVRFAPAAGVTAVVLIAHAWVIGGGPSVVRATAMAGTYLALRLIDQRTHPVHAVAVAASGILMANPLEITGAGFWLTFGATGALLMVAARGAWPLRRGWLTPLVGIILATAAVELLLTPVSAFVFERVTLAGLVLNLVAIPAMGLVQASATLCVLADALAMARAADLCGYVTHVAASMLVGSSSLVTKVPWATWRVPPPPVALLAAYYLTVAAWWWASRPPIDSRTRRLASRLTATNVLVLWVWIAFAPHARWPPGSGEPLRVTAIDVGQGDALLVTTPEGQTLLVDAGGIAAGRFDIGDRVVGPSLRARRLLHLDYIAVTHGDLDHLGGVRGLLRDFHPREVWAGVPVAGHLPLEAVRREARATRTPWRWLQRGDRLELGGVEVVAHHPPAPDWERQRVRNDDSLVLEVRYGAVSVWLTGDITRTVEDELAASAFENGRIVVLKAAHHGSLTSSASGWLTRLRPAVVLVSAGRGNLFGHPAPAVLQRYANVGAEVFRTDLDGQIELVTNGHFVEVTTFTGRRWRLR